MSYYFIETLYTQNPIALISRKANRPPISRGREETAWEMNPIKYEQKYSRVRAGAERWVRLTVTSFSIDIIRFF